jgi:anthranilate/para-aminobenzoate synthase component I
MRRSAPSTSCSLILAETISAEFCKYGTVHVEELMFIERYSHVMHLVSSLRGQLPATSIGSIR